MEIRLLNREEIPKAAEIANGVFQYCLRSSFADDASVRFFVDYAKPEKLLEMNDCGRLQLWGAFEQQQMVAMSAMQPEGHITMLYVLPLFQRRNCGKALLKVMRQYAGQQLGHKKVTLNVMPVWTASYFAKNGFKQMEQPMNAPFMAMQAKALCPVGYEKKKIPAGWMLGTSLGGLTACAVMAIGFMIYYFQ